MKTNCITQFLVGVACVALLAGCQEEEKYQLRFSHYLHVEENGMECSECHGDVGEFKAITHATCLNCHEEPEAEEISAETCGICHQEKQLAIFSVPEAVEGEETDGSAAEETPGRNIFVHTEALADKCTECHDSLLNEELENVPMLQRRDVLAIRETAHQSGQACSTCHAEMDPGVPPPSHDVAWIKRHGNYFRQDDASCSVCHTQDSCTDCHSVMQPVSHNNMFRTRTHGAVAAWGRESCQVCHEEDSCTSCHAQTRPRTHNARWSANGMRPTHCIGCHDTSTPGDGCATCHEGGNDVTLHEQYWGGINHNQPGIEDCYQCHWIQTP